MPKDNLMFDDEGDIVEDLPRPKALPKIKKEAYLERRLNEKIDVRSRRVDTELIQ